MKKEEIAQLVSRAQAGDESAFAMLHGRYVNPIFRFISISIWNRDDAQDITQHVFIKMWQALPNYKDSGKPFSAWIYRIARNAVIDFSRKRRDIPLDDMPPKSDSQHQEDPRKMIEQSAQRQDIHAALQHITEDQREVLLLKFIEGYSAKEIATLTDKSEASIRQLQSRGLAKLRELMKNRP